MSLSIGKLTEMFCGHFRAEVEAREWETRKHNKSPWNQQPLGKEAAYLKGSRDPQR